MKPFCLLYAVALFSALAATAFADTESFPVQALMGSPLATNPQCFVTQPANASWHNTSFDVYFKGNDSANLSFVALFERNNSGGWGAWSVVYNVTSPVNNTIYTYNHSLGGSYEVQYYCNATNWPSGSSNVSETRTFHVDTVAPTITWLSPASDNSSNITYGESWWLNVNVTDYNLQYCNLTVNDSTGLAAYFNCLTPAVLPTNETCAFNDSISSIGFDTGNWTFKVDAMDNASNAVTQTKTGFLDYQNTSHSIWDRTRDPDRTRDWLISAGMWQRITMYWHTLAGNVSGNYSADGYFGNTTPLSTYEFADDWINSTHYARVTHAGLPNVLYIYRLNDSVQTSSLVLADPVCLNFLGAAGLWCQNDEGYCYISYICVVPPYNEPTYIYKLYFNGTQTFIKSWNYNTPGAPWGNYNFGGNDIAKTGDYWFVTARPSGHFWGKDIIKFNNAWVPVANYSVMPYASSWTITSNGYNKVFVIERGAGVNYRIVTQLDANGNITSTFNLTECMCGTGDPFLIDNIYYNSRYVLCGGCTENPYYVLNGSVGITGASCRLTNTYEGISNASMTETGGGKYIYDYNESAEDGSRIDYTAVCTKSGYGTKSETGLYHTANWHTPDDYLSLDQHQWFPTYFDTSFTTTNKLCSPVAIENNDIDYGAGAELYAYYNQLPAVSANTLRLYADEDGQLGAEYGNCSINASATGWHNCTFNTTKDWYTGEQGWACVDNGEGVAMRSGGGNGHMVGSWQAVGEVGVTLHSPYNVRVTENVTCRFCTDNKYIVATQHAIYSTDFVDKQLHVIDSVPAPWQVTHISTTFDYDLIVRLKHAATGECKARRYGYTLIETSETSVDCDDTQAGIYFIAGKYYALGQGGLYRSDSLSGFVLVEDRGAAFTPTLSQIQYQKDGGASIVYTDDATNPLFGEYVFSRSATGDVYIIHSDLTSAIMQLFIGDQHRQDLIISPMYSDSLHTNPGLFFNMLAPSSLLQFYDNYPGGPNAWYGGTGMSSLDYAYGTLGYGDNWLFVYSNGADSQMKEREPVSGAERVISSPLLADTVAVSKFVPAIMSFKTSKDYTDIIMQGGSVFGDESFKQGDVLNAVEVWKIFDSSKSEWYIGKVPGMTVGVYVDDVLLHTYVMQFTGIRMAPTEQSAVVINGSKVKLKFYSFDVFQDELEYDVMKAQLLLPAKQELFEVQDNKWFTPNPWYYSGKVYEAVYLNNYNTVLTVNPLASDPGLACSYTMTRQSTGEQAAGPAVFTLMGGNYALEMDYPNSSQPGDEMTITLECANGSTYEANYSTTMWFFNNDTYSYKLNNWETLNNQGSFNWLSIFAENDSVGYDVCVTKHVWHDYLSSAPSNMYVNQLIGDNSGYQYAGQWVELPSYSKDASKTCFAGSTTFFNVQNLPLKPLTNYYTRYAVQFASHNDTELPKLYWAGGNYMPATCHIYDISLTYIDYRHHKLTAYYTCRGASPQMQWDFTLDKEIKTKSITAFGYVEDPMASGESVLDLYVFPEEDRQYFNFTCGSQPCLKVVKYVDGTLLVDLTTAFIDYGGNIYPGSEYTEHFQINVGKDDNTATESGAGVWGAGGDLMSGITMFAVENPLSFLLAIVLIVVLAPLALVLIR